MKKSALKKAGFIVKQNQGKSGSAGVLKNLEHLNKNTSIRTDGSICLHLRYLMTFINLVFNPANLSAYELSI